MRIFLDTHVWLWMLGAPERLSADARALLQDTRNELVLSAASCWEIAIKVGTRRLELPGVPEFVIPEMIEASGVMTLPVMLTHTLRVASLPHHHRDPFDRLLVAQAQLEGLPILTSDPLLTRYDVDLIPA